MSPPSTFRFPGFLLLILLALAFGFTLKAGSAGKNGQSPQKKRPPAVPQIRPPQDPGDPPPTPPPTPTPECPTDCQMAQPQSPCPLSSTPWITGQWSPLLHWEGVSFTDANNQNTIQGYAVAIHTSVLPNRKVLFWGNITDAGSVFTWDGDTQHLPVAAPRPPLHSPVPDNIFCSAQSFLPDGKLLVTGGYCVRQGRSSLRECL